MLGIPPLPLGGNYLIDSSNVVDLHKSEVKASNDNPQSQPRYSGSIFNHHKAALSKRVSPLAEWVEENQNRWHDHRATKRPKCYNRSSATCH